MRLLSDAELRALRPAETAAFAGPIPTQIVSSDEYFPLSQSATQRRVDARTRALSDTVALRHGLSLRRFFQTASGMAAAFRDRDTWLSRMAGRGRPGHRRSQAGLVQGLHDR